jgi:hypothetical protein
MKLNSMMILTAVSNWKNGASLTLQKTLVELRMKVVHKTLHIFFWMKLFQKFIVKDAVGKRVLAG